MGVQPARAAGTPLQSAGPTQGIPRRPGSAFPLPAPTNEYLHGAAEPPRRAARVPTVPWGWGAPGLLALMATPQHAGAAGPCWGPRGMGTAVRLPQGGSPRHPQALSFTPSGSSSSPGGPRGSRAKQQSPAHPTVPRSPHSARRTGPACPMARPRLPPRLLHSKAMLSPTLTPKAGPRSAPQKGHAQPHTHPTAGPCSAPRLPHSRVTLSPTLAPQQSHTQPHARPAEGPCSAPH